MADKKSRICIIGAGPTGMCTLYQIKLLRDDAPDVTCYEKQETWNGQWNYSWRTGTDEYGESVNGSMYRHLWTIGPKESFEFEDYSFQKHFGKNLPSYLPREVIRMYLHGRWTKGKCGDMTPFVNFRHVVNSVDYRAETDDFVVSVKDLINNTDKTETFSHVIVGSGKYTVPHYPEFPGMNTFPGRILHSHAFKDAREFKGKTVLIIGASYSASDIAIQLIKYGAKQIICSVRKESMGLKWPPGIEERQLERVNNNMAYFKDGSCAEMDSIMLCTGYMYHYPFLKGNLRFDVQEHTNEFPDNLYKGTVWTKGGNNKLFFLGCYEEFFDMPLFVIQAEWCLRYILGKIPSEPVSRDEMAANVQTWQERRLQFESPWDIIGLQRDFALLLARDVEYPTKYILAANEVITKCVEDRLSDVCTFRDKCFASIYTGEISAEHHTLWMDALDDAPDEYLK